MDELQKRGGVLIYDPDLIVHRRPRPNMKAFARMLMTYGRGRAEQFRVNPTLGSALNFVPPGFCLYLLVLPFLGWLGLIPLGFYCLAVLGQTLLSAFRAGMIKAFAALPLVVLTHVLYGIGFWRGLFTRLNTSRDRPKIEVVLERVADGIGPGL